MKQHYERPRSRSRSLSRSPVRSELSTRSRSRSLTPKRRRREDGVKSRRIESPPRNNPPRYAQLRKKSISPAPSRRSEDTRGRPRRSSVSSFSTRSRSRSRSRSDSPEARRKATHRLPTLTSMREIEMKAKTLARQSWGNQGNQRTKQQYSRKGQEQNNNKGDRNVSVFGLPLRIIKIGRAHV